MDPVTHVATGLLCSQLIPSPSRAWAAVAGVIFALLPDIDYFLVFWDRLAFIRYHRGFTHSLLALPLLALLGAGAGRVLGGPRWVQPLFWLALAVLGIHLLLDLATSYGTQLFTPFSRARLAWDWLFIIDPYLTALLVAGALAALLPATWGRRVGTVCLAAAGVYLLACGLYHRQALSLARQVLQPEPQAATAVAALPQPFSCRRWHLIAAAPGEVKQAFVQLPFWACLGLEPEGRAGSTVAPPRKDDCQAARPYQPPGCLRVRTWIAAAEPSLAYPPEAGEILARFLEFARFPLLYRAQTLADGHLLEWLDLRFSVPGRGLPFVLQLRLDAQGRLQRWVLGRQRQGPGA